MKIIKIYTTELLRKWILDLLKVETPRHKGALSYHNLIEFNSFLFTANVAPKILSSLVILKA